MAHFIAHGGNPYPQPMSRSLPPTQAGAHGSNQWMCGPEVVLESSEPHVTYIDEPRPVPPPPPPPQRKKSAVATTAPWGAGGKKKTTGGRFVSLASFKSMGASDDENESGEED